MCGFLTLLYEHTIIFLVDFKSKQDRQVGVSVPYKDSFLLVGGRGHRNELLDQILWYESSGRWTKLRTKLNTPGARWLPLLVDPSTFRKC